MVLLSQHAHTHFSLSPRLLSFCSARAQSAHTHISLSASAQFMFSACTVRTHTSLSLHLLSLCSARAQSAHTHLSLCICSVYVQRAHRHTSLSLHLRSFCSRQRRAELYSVKHRYLLLASLILYASIAKITAQLLSLSYEYFN